MFCIATASYECYLLYLLTKSNTFKRMFYTLGPLSVMLEINLKGIESQFVYLV